MSEEVWDTQMNVNLKSVFLTCKHVLPIMVTQQRGAIVNVASASGLRWTGSAQVAYAATKAGVIQLSKVVAVQHAKDGIRVNTVVPGQLHTPMVEARLAGQRAGGDELVVMCKPCSIRGSSAYRWGSWVMVAIRPVRPFFWPVTRPALSREPRSWWMVV